MSPSFLLRYIGKSDSITISVWNHKKIHKKQGAGFLGCVRLLSNAINRLKDTGCKCLYLIIFLSLWWKSVICFKSHVGLFSPVVYQRHPLMFMTVFTIGVHFFVSLWSFLLCFAKSWLSLAVHWNNTSLLCWGITINLLFTIIHKMSVFWLMQSYCQNKVVVNKQVLDQQGN